MAEHLALQLFNPVQAHQAMTAQLWPQINSQAAQAFIECVMP